MSGDFTDVIKRGPVKIKGRRLGLWKSQWLQLHSASSKGPCRLEKYSNREEAQQLVDDVNRPVHLNGILSIKRFAVEGHKQAIEISFNSPQTPPFLFCPENDSGADDWYDTLEQVRTSRDYESDMFHVYLLPTPNLTARGECLLQVSSKDISLYDTSDPIHLITRWPLSCLRRYGRDGLKFTIESGRSSPTGEGLFVFSSYQNEEIYNTVRRASMMIQESLRVIDTSQRSEDGPAVPQRPLTSVRSADASVPPMPPRSAADTPRHRSFESAARGALPAMPGT